MISYFITTKNKWLITKKDLVKILGRGELKAKLKVTVHGYSATAKAAIEAAGGTAEVC